MSISYVDAVAKLPRPTVREIAEFVDYVTTAHSWYKHLPLLPPGLPFTFYLDPNAGREWIENGSHSGFRERLANTPARERFHYTWQPTSDYIARFGYLTYFADAGTSFRIPTKKGVLSTASAPRIHVENRGWMGVKRSWIPVPEDVRLEGTVNLTGVIHPIGQSVHSWTMTLHYPEIYGLTQSDIIGYDDPAADDITRTAIGLLGSALFHPERAEAILRIEELEKRVLPAWADVQMRQMSDAIHRVLDHIYAQTRR